MPKTHEEREVKRANRQGYVPVIDLREAADVAPTYRKTRWGWALSELTGRCFTYADWGGGWPFTMGFRKHLWTPKGICRRCASVRKPLVEWRPDKQGFSMAGRREAR